MKSKDLHPHPNPQITNHDLLRKHSKTRIFETKCLRLNSSYYKGLEEEGPAITAIMEINISISLRPRPLPHPGWRKVGESKIDFDFEL